jgi:hypothetical protein
MPDFRINPRSSARHGCSSLEAEEEDPRLERSCLEEEHEHELGINERSRSSQPRRPPPTACTTTTTTPRPLAPGAPPREASYAAPRPLAPGVPPREASCARGEDATTLLPPWMTGIVAAASFPSSEVFFWLFVFWKRSGLRRAVEESCLRRRLAEEACLCRQLVGNQYEACLPRCATGRESRGGGRKLGGGGVAEAEPREESWWWR